MIEGALLDHLSVFGKVSGQGCLSGLPLRVGLPFCLLSFRRSFVCVGGFGKIGSFLFTKTDLIR